MITLINALLPLVANLAPVVAHLIAQIKGQTGMTDDQILAHASSTLDEDQTALLAEQLRLQAKIDGQKSVGFVQVGLLIVLTLVLLCGLAAGCKTAAKVNTNPYSGPSKAADDIALSISLLTETERNLETQGLITPQEGLLVINGLVVLHDADVSFVADIRAAKVLDPASANRLLIPSLGRLKQALADLQAKGVLGIKNEKAKATFQTALNVVDVSLATIQVLLEGRQ